MQNILLAAIIFLVVGVGGYGLVNNWFSGGMAKTDDVAMQKDAAPTDTTAQQTPEAAKSAVRSEMSVIGKSVEGKDILAYHYGSNDAGAKELLIVGGIHGSYSANTAKVADEAVAWLKTNPSVVPANVSVTVIPNVNPDGLAKSAQRFNANNVDLNRNFDCDWAAESKWQNKTVSGGSAPFSEPEAKSVQNYVEMYKPAAAVVFFSSEGEVYPSGCGEVLPASVTLASAYAAASGYKANTTDFTHYKITGDMVNWMAKSGIPAISVLLSDHTNTEWAKNEKGLAAVLQSLAGQTVAE